MSLQRLGLGISVFSAVIMAEIASAQQVIRWDVYSPRTVIAGSGCQKDVDAFATENGNDLSVVFTNLGVDLPGGGGSRLADRKNCSVRIPAEIAKGYYIGELTQRVSYGVTKSAGSQGSVATRSTFFGYNVSPYTVVVPYGTHINNPLMVQSRVDRFQVNTRPDWVRGFCAPTRNPQGLYSANLAVAGQKDSRFEDLLMFVDGLDLKFEVLTRFVQCRL
jgi:hypothetical protein